jgi:CRISPR-associated endonuclease/helicase Cas3
MNGFLGALGQWPGKRDDQDRRHPAVWHMLDVAAAAELIVASGPLSRLPQGWQRGIVFLIALHDCGKISQAFRAQIETRCPPPEHCRHWQLSLQMLLRLDEVLAGFLGGEEVPREVLYAAVAGHHGRPPARDMGAIGRKQLEQIGPAAMAAGRDWIELLAPLFAGASLAGISEAEAKRLSWLVSGTTVQADWIGSNTDWFPVTGPEPSVAKYWEIARGQAQVALGKAGLLQSQPANPSPQDLIGGNLRPMQAAVAAVVLPDGPCLALIEDATGAGKTEAALILAQRMITAGKAGGLFFALPTMATSEAMFSRMRPMLRRLFQGEPSLALLHGKRALSENFTQVRGAQGGRPEDAACAAWIADDRRLSLLAEIGVGTIDQALMAVLPTRFNTLRMVALAGRVLIVDEAHSYDPYMEVELQALLRFHAAFGGSAIVMTATLPKAMREGYVQAFQRGLGAVVPVELPNAYPALSMIGAHSATRAVDPHPATCRRIDITRLPDAASALALLKTASGQGAACLWVRNAVDDAIAAVTALRAEGIEAELLHARFAMCDRMDIESRVLGRFGKQGAGREGRVLVATQVVESSLDLDFDLIISDLAPIGALIQRAGRLWRHMDLRPAERRPVSGPSLHVVMPDPGEVTEARWLHHVLEAGAWVYPLDLQWRTARSLVEVGAIVAPEGLRDLIEAVHGADPAPVPKALARAEDENFGRAMAEAGQARHHILKLPQGFGAVENIFSDESFPTRLGEKQMTLILTRRGPSGLVLWAEDPWPVRAQALSEVQMSFVKYKKTGLEAAQGAAEIAAFTQGWKDWERATRAVAVVGEGGRICEGLRYDRENGLQTA